ncbi:MAG: histidine--tRNA ligase [Sphingobium sp.]
MAKIQTPRPIRGTQDMLGGTPEGLADRFAHVVETFERVRKLYGFRRVEVPVFEATAVFARSLGESTDVVAKEMYSFEDRGGDSITLRPEFTAGLARAYITEGWQQFAPLKIATHGPLFRYERPQKGRYRQFHQIDAEVIGAGEPLADVELLCFADHLLRELGVSEGVTLTLNTLGDAPSRDAWRDALVAHFEAHRDALSQDSVDRLARNPLRILDSKDERDQAVVAGAPGIDDYLTDAAAAFFAQVTDGLDAAGVAWTRNPRLVRGLDYYRHTAFEFITDRLGAQGTVLGGGRYDGLIENMGGPATPAVGWAAGIERLAMLLDAPEMLLRVTIIPELISDENIARRICHQLRRSGFACDMSLKHAHRKDFDRAYKKSDAILVVTERQDILAERALANIELKIIAQKDDKMLRLKKDLVDALSQSFVTKPIQGYEHLLEWNLFIP